MQVSDVIYLVNNRLLDQNIHIRLLPTQTPQRTLKLADHLSKQSQSEVKIVVHMLIVKRVLVVPYKLVNVDQVKLNKTIVFMHKLQMMNILWFSIAGLLQSKEYDKLHQKLLHLLPKIDLPLPIVSFLLRLMNKPILFSNHSGQNVSYDLVIRIDQVTTTQLISQIDDLGRYRRILLLEQQPIVILQQIHQHPLSLTTAPKTQTPTLLQLLPNFEIVINLPQYFDEHTIQIFLLRQSQLKTNRQ